MKPKVGDKILFNLEGKTCELAKELAKYMDETFECTIIGIRTDRAFGDAAYFDPPTPRHPQFVKGNIDEIDVEYLRKCIDAGIAKIGEFEQYEHHGELVWTRTRTKGKHRENCLCYSCKHFEPGEETNCVRAQGLYEYCVRWGMTTPVFECPIFGEKKR